MNVLNITDLVAKNVEFFVFWLNVKSDFHSKTIKIVNLSFEHNSTKSTDYWSFSGGRCWLFDRDFVFMLEKLIGLFSVDCWLNAHRWIDFIGFHNSHAKHTLLLFAKPQSENINRANLIRIWDFRFLQIFAVKPLRCYRIIL